MSAIVTVRGDDGVLIVSDTICYDSDGIVMSTAARKVLPIIELNCVIGNVGAGGFATTISQSMAAKYNSFDELKSGIESDFSDVYEFMSNSAYIDTFPGVSATLFLAGWSDEAERYETYRISARDKEMIISGESQTSPGFQLMPTPGIWLSSSYKPEDAARFGLDRDDIDNLETAVRMVCACRAASCDSGVGDFDGQPYAVGGDILVTILQRNRMSQWRVHSWPDVAGRRLDPTAGDAMPSFPIQLF